LTVQNRQRPFQRLDLRFIYAILVYSGASDCRHWVFGVMSPPALPHSLHRQLHTARDLLERRSTQEGEEALPVNLPALEKLFPHGLLRSELLELVGTCSSGRFSLVMSLLGAATSVGEAVTLVDLGDQFDPQSAASADVLLERLLWLRPTDLRAALAATETAITGGLSLVVLDLGTPPIPGGRGAQSSWQRLLQKARTHRVTLLVSSPYRVCGAAATIVVETVRQRAKWQGRNASNLLLRAVRSRMTLGKVRGAMSGANVELTLRYDQGAVQEDLAISDEAVSSSDTTTRAIDAA